MNNRARWLVASLIVLGLSGLLGLRVQAKDHEKQSRPPTIEWESPSKIKRDSVPEEIAVATTDGKGVVYLSRDEFIRRVESGEAVGAQNGERRVVTTDEDGHETVRDEHGNPAS